MEGLKTTKLMYKRKTRTGEGNNEQAVTYDRRYEWEEVEVGCVGRVSSSVGKRRLWYALWLTKEICDNA